MWGLVCALMVMFLDSDIDPSHSSGFDDGGLVDVVVIEEEERQPTELPNDDEWFLEDLDSDLMAWIFSLNRVQIADTCSHRMMSIIDSKQFGKALVIDAKLQIAEMDEFIYHECLVHPALLLQRDPKSVFIMGGGDGCAAREALKNFCIENVEMCDWDRKVFCFCFNYQTQNRAAFRDPRLRFGLDDAKSVLELKTEKFDVIIGDLPGPIEGGTCNHLYTKAFYEHVVKPKLKKGGIFVTQAGPAGVLSHKPIFTSIYSTVKQVFQYSCEWVMVW